jgi:hypothetical protein
MTALNYTSYIYVNGQQLKYNSTAPFSVNGNTYMGIITLSGSGTLFNVLQRATTPEFHSIQLNETQFVAVVNYNEGLPTEIKSLLPNKQAFLTTVRNESQLYLVTDNSVQPTASTVNLAVTQNNIYVCLANTNVYWTAYNNSLTLGVGSTFTFDMPSAANSSSGGGATITSTPIGIYAVVGTDGTNLVYASSGITMNAGTNSINVTRIGNGPLIGDSNIAVGYNTLQVATGGANNTAVGSGAMNTILSTATNNTAVGNGAMTTCVNPQYNVAIGAGAMYNGGNSQYNTAVGDAAMALAGDSQYSTAIGWGTLTSGSYSTALGAGALNSANATSTNNIAVGYNTLASLYDGANNIAIGNSVGLGGQNHGSNNIYIDTQGTQPIITDENNVIRIGLSTGPNRQVACWIPVIMNTLSIYGPLVGNQALIPATALVGPSGGIITNNDNNPARTWTLDTGANISGLFGNANSPGDTFTTKICNLNGGGIQITGPMDSSVTVHPASNLIIYSTVLYFVNTGINQWSCFI